MRSTTRVVIFQMNSLYIAGCLVSGVICMYLVLKMYRYACYVGHNGLTRRGDVSEKDREVLNST